MQFLQRLDSRLGYGNSSYPPCYPYYPYYGAYQYPSQNQQRQQWQQSPQWLPQWQQSPQPPQKRRRTDEHHTPSGWMGANPGATGVADGARFTGHICWFNYVGHGSNGRVLDFHGMLMWKIDNKPQQVISFHTDQFTDVSRESIRHHALWVNEPLSFDRGKKMGCNKVVALNVQRLLVDKPLTK